jgi:hypothetical protein
MATGILSEGERAFFAGEKKTDDPDGYAANARYRARQRMDQIEDDLIVLEQAGQDELVNDFYTRFGRLRRLEREVERLRAQLEDESN